MYRTGSSIRDIITSGTYLNKPYNFFMRGMAATDIPWNPLSEQSREKHSAPWITVNILVGVSNGYTYCMFCHLHSFCHKCFSFKSQLALWVQNQNTSEQADIWETAHYIYNKSQTALCWIRSGSSLHVINTEHSGIRVLTQIKNINQLLSASLVLF